MTDVFSKKERSEIMSHIRSKNTVPELKLFSMLRHLYHNGFRYRKHYKKVFGKPDIAFTKQRVAIFIDSEFWHGMNFKITRQRLPKKYWREKIENNMKRDKNVNNVLNNLGWKVIRIWSKDFLKKPDKYIKKIIKILGKK